MFLHDRKKLDDNLRRRANQNLSLASLFSIDNGFQAVVENGNADHLLQFSKFQQEKGPDPFRHCSFPENCASVAFYAESESNTVDNAGEIRNSCIKKRAAQSACPVDGIIPRYREQRQKRRHGSKRDRFPAKRFTFSSFC